MKRLFCVCLPCILCFMLLSGCWDYHGLDEMDIVTGIAVDKMDDIYYLTFEIIDTQVGDSKGSTSVLYVEMKGKTIFDAVRNSKKKLINKLYGGNMQTLIISKQIAQEDGVLDILEETLRDGEPRETISVVISQEETAKEILTTKGIDSKIISYEINGMVEEDSRITASTVNVTLYKAYNHLKGTGNSLVLPAVRCVQNDDETVVEGNGIALFDHDRLNGFLTPEQTKFYLFIVNEIKGGAISFPTKNSDESISMEIKDCATKTKAAFDNGQLNVSLSIKVKLNIMEMKSQLSISQAQQRKELEQLTEEYLQESISYFFRDVQTQHKKDIFGLGRLIYKKDPKLWKTLEKNWDQLFQNAVIEVNANADVLSSGVLKNY